MNSEDATFHETYYFGEETASESSVTDSSSFGGLFGNLASSESSSFFDTPEVPVVASEDEVCDEQVLADFRIMNLLTSAYDIHQSVNWLTNDPVINELPFINPSMESMQCISFGDYTDESLCNNNNQVSMVASSEELVESSVDNQKYPLDNGLIIQNQADASDSSSDSSTDSLSDSILVSVYNLEKKRGRRRSKRVWTNQENEKLLAICNELQVIKNHRCWNSVAKKMGGTRTPKQCREHYGHLVSDNKKSTWSEEEDTILLNFLRGDISEEELTRSLKRSAKQINERKAILERNLRGWETEEDELIFRLSHENKSVRYVTKELRNHGFNRTNQQVKDRLSFLTINVHP